jgi:hypothetical protein
MFLISLDDPPVLLSAGDQIDLQMKWKILYIRPILRRGHEETAGHHRAMSMVLAVVIVALVAGCGGGSGGSSSSPAAGEARRQFQNPEGPKGSEAVATFGKEAGEAERSEASAVLAENLRARQEANFAKQCATLGKLGLESVLGPWKNADAKEIAKCTAALKGFAEPLSGSKAVRKNTLSGEIAALRIKGGQAYALYHGNDGKDYAMPMEQEGGSWKVGSITTIELPTGKAKTEPPQKKGA